MFYLSLIVIFQELQRKEPRLLKSDSQSNEESIFLKLAAKKNATDNKVMSETLKQITWCICFQAGLYVEHSEVKAVI